MQKSLDATEDRGDNATTVGTNQLDTSDGVLRKQARQGLALIDRALFPPNFGQQLSERGQFKVESFNAGPVKSTSFVVPRLPRRFRFAPGNRPNGDRYPNESIVRQSGSGHDQFSTKGNPEKRSGLGDYNLRRYHNSVGLCCH